MLGRETEQRILIIMYGTLDEALEGFITSYLSLGKISQSKPASTLEISGILNGHEIHGIVDP